MSPHVAVAERIIRTVRGIPECSLEELTHRLPDLSWAEVFPEVDRLSRSGQVRLTRSGVRCTTTIRAL